MAVQIASVAGHIPQRAPAALGWKRLLYLTHRWIGIVLGTLVFVWFTSGIAMAFYDWPAYTDSQLLSQLTPFDPTDSLVGFAAATRAAQGRIPSLTFPAKVTDRTPIGGRLFWWHDRPAYQIWGELAYHPVALALVDARTGSVLSPIDPAAASAIAAERVEAGARVKGVDLLARGDHYLMNRDYAHEYPAYRVRFANPSATAVYVEQRGGTAFGRATSTTRLTTWLGTVPHWMYFQWLLQDREALWQQLSVVLPAIAVLIALTGITLGLVQLFPNRKRGRWRPTAYRGVSKWHHLAGVIFGLLVLTWTFTGILENLGPSSFPTGTQVARARGDRVHWDQIRITEAGALAQLSDRSRPVAIDLVQLDDQPGYDIHLADGWEFWVDATTGHSRSVLAADDADRIASRVMGGSAPIARADFLTRYDSYYYARPGRERHLPAWRVTFADAVGSVVYLDAVNGTPVGFTDHAIRVWRWARDAIHSFDYPALNTRRLLWYAVVLPLLLGGATSAVTGAYLLVRRVRRMV